LAGDLAGSLEKWKAVLAGHVQDLDKASANFGNGVRTGFDPAIGALQNSLAEHARQIEQTRTAWGQQLQTALEAHGSQVTAASQQMAQQLEQTRTAWGQQLQAALEGYNSQLAAASRQLAGQLERVGDLGQRIEEVLHVQQAVDGTLKAVTTTEEFRSTLAALRSHLEESDAVLREVTKPRTIRLVESEHDL